MATRASPADAAAVALRYRRTFHGPNPYAADPVIVAALTFAPAVVRDGRARCTRIAEQCGAWFESPVPLARCDTPLGIAEFLVSWALAMLTRWRGFLHAATAVEEDGEVVVALGFHHPQLSQRALSLAVTVFSQGEDASSKAIAKGITGLWDLCGRVHPDYQVVFLMQAAREAGVPYMRALARMKTWQFGWGARSELFLESLNRGDSAIGDRISRDKPAGKQFLQGIGVPVPPHVLADRETDLARAARTVGWPCVVKPIDAGRSVGVVTDIADLAQLEAAVAETLASHGAPAMIERQVPGEVYRILVVRGKVAYVVRRAAPHVVGDGTSTVRDLIGAENRRRLALRSKMDFLGAIPFDEECVAALAREGIGADEVVAKGRTVPLRRIPLLSSGAVYTDVTAETHSDTRRMAELIAAALGIGNCGIDFVTTDIARPMTEAGAVLEANTMPGLRVPMMAGHDPLDIGRQVLGDHPARLPAALLIAPRDRLAEVRAAVSPDDATGWSIGEEAGVGSLVLVPGEPERGRAVPPPAHRGVSMIVRNPLVERVFVACPLEDIVAAGLPLDRFDAIACLDCTPDAPWEPVLRRASTSYRAAKDLAAALRACGRPAAG